MENSHQFDSVSILLPVMNETTSLLSTVRIISEECLAKDIKEFILIVCAKTTQESMKICEDWVKENPQQFILCQQALPGLGGALRGAFEIARGSHTLMMASDMETDPTDVKKLIEEAKKNPSHIITANRWKKGGSFSGYGFEQVLLNYIFQNYLRLLYQTHLSDMTFGFRIFPTSLIQLISWEELSHPFLLETVLKPLRLGVPILEIASQWKVRREGISQNSLRTKLQYVRASLRYRFCPIHTRMGAPITPFSKNRVKQYKVSQ